MYRTLEVTIEQIANMWEEDELEDKGSPGMRKMVGGPADIAPKLGRR